MDTEERARLIEKIDTFSTSPEKVEDLLWMSRYKIASDLRRVDVLEKALREIMKNTRNYADQHNSYHTAKQALGDA